MSRPEGQVYDQAHALARALQQSPEAEALRSAWEKVKNDPDARRMVEDLQQRQMDLLQAQMSGLDTTAQQRELENLAQLVGLHNEVATYLNAQYRFGVLWEDVNRILQQAVAAVVAEEENPGPPSDTSSGPHLIV